MRARDTPIPNLTRTQQRRAAAVVLDRLGDGDAAREVLAALFAPHQPIPPSTNTARDAARRQAHERAHKQSEVRAWARSVGIEVPDHGTLSRELNEAYAAAHGGVS